MQQLTEIVLTFIKHMNDLLMLNKISEEQYREMTKKKYEFLRMVLK